MAGVSQTTLMTSASAAWLLAGVPSTCVTRALAVLDPPGGEIDRAARPLDARARAPGPAADPVDRGEVGPAQTPTRAEERDRLQKVGLARAVGAGQHHRPRVDLQTQPRIGAEVAQRQPTHRRERGPRDRLRPATRTARRVQGERHHTRIGIST
jgi:hypothetical protein